MSFPVALTSNVGLSELVGLGYDGLVWTRPDDIGSAWTQRFTLPFGCCWTGITESPLGGSLFAITEGGDLHEIASDYSASFDRPDVFYSVEAFAANDQTSELLALSYDGLVFTRPGDATTQWTQRFTLPFVDFSNRWVGLTQGPVDGDVFAITRGGDLYELASDFSSSSDRPDVPASNVVTLTSNAVTGELLALTGDGRVFSRRDDASSPWTLQFTLPRAIIP